MTPSVLARLAPAPQAPAARAIWTGYTEALLTAGPSVFVAHEITTRLRVCHLLAQWLHECGGFTIVHENLSYSAEGLVREFGFDPVRKVWRHSARITDAEARLLAHRPEAIAERIYGLGNPKKAAELGNHAPGDAYRYRGCGIQQITGGNDHRRYAARIGCAVEDLALPANAIHAALLEWTGKGCNALADADDIEGVTRRINGGQKGLEQRRMYLARCKALITDEMVADFVATEPGLAHARHDGPSAPTPPAATPIAVLPINGPSRQDLRDAQGRLADLGYHCGSSDGVSGPLTRQALLSFQDVNGLPTSGALDAATQAVLLTSEAKPFPLSPERRATSGDALAARGSETVAAARDIDSLAKKAAGVAGALAIDEASGAKLVDRAFDLASRLTGLVRDGGDAMLSPKFLILAGIVAGAVVLVRLARVIEARRVADARDGRNLGR